MQYNIRRPLATLERNALSEHSDILAHLLYHRGIRDAEEARTFISPDYEAEIHDPFLLKDAERSATRILKAIKNRERIAIYSDYDADGIPGAAIFDDFFRRIGFSDFSIYIPHRHDEGFGLNVEAIEQLAGEGVKVLVTVDCGITDIVPVSLAKERGIDVIITDHHEPPPILPPAFAIIDHKQGDCAYPDKNLCGSGVAFKLIQAILSKDRLGLKEGMEKWLLDLVGIATMSDMVPLTGENRLFAKFGLSVLRKSPRKGLMQMLRKLKISQRHITEDDIAFMVTPRINAASRMGVPMDAFHMLTADNDDDAYESVERLDKVNSERKGVVASLVKEVKRAVRERHLGVVPSVIVLGNPVWRPSLLGLVANSCAEEFRRPVFLWGRDGDNQIKGSCRSEGRSSVVELMRAVPTGIFAQFGGHHHSGGFSVSNDQIHFLELRLNEAAQSIRGRGNGTGAVSDDKSSGKSNEIADPGKEDQSIDAELALDDIGEALWKDIDKLSPFGMGNPKPVFIFKKVAPLSVKIFGKAGEHVELSFENKMGRKIPAISFFGAGSEWMKGMKAGKPIDLIASMEKSMFRGREELRLRIIGIA